MYETLYRYLLQNKNLSLPGVGSLLLQRTAAQDDFVNKKIRPPAFRIILQKLTDSPSSKFFKWLSASLQLSYADAFAGFNEFVTGLKKQIMDGDSINWKGVGTFTMSINNSIKFIPEQQQHVEEPILSDRVIREKKEHLVRVGEENKTSVEMTALLNQPAEKKSFWWAYIYALIIIAVLFIGFYFSEMGISLSSTANIKKLVPMKSSSQEYKMFP